MTTVLLKLYYVLVEIPGVTEKILLVIELRRIYINTANGNILFSVDMTVLNTVGIYDPSIDSMQVRGAFNGWSDSEPLRSKMNQNPLNPNVWTLNVAFQKTSLGEGQQYKYYVNVAKDSLWADGWERPTSIGGGNRSVNFEGKSNQVATPVYYDDVLPGQVIDAGKSVSITFSVDMRPAMDSTKIAVPFNPATDSLFWVSEEPAFIRTQGWTDTDQMKVPFINRSGWRQCLYRYIDG